MASERPRDSNLYSRSASGRALRDLCSRSRLGVAALLGASASVASCSVLLDFDGRPAPGAGGASSTTFASPSSSATGAGAGSTTSATGGASAGTAGPLVSAFDLAACTPSIARPTDPQACDYVDQSCSGFGDLSSPYTVSGSLDVKTNIACDRQALAAYGFTAPNATTPELRIVARTRSQGVACDAKTVDGGVPSESLVVLRIDPAMMTSIDETPIQLVAGGAPVPDSVPMAIGRTERRVLFAYLAVDPSDQKTKVFVATTAIDVGPAAGETVPTTWEVHLAAALEVSPDFDPVRVTGADDPVKGKLYVAVEDRNGLPPASTFANEAATESLGFAAALDFKNGTAKASGERLGERSQTSLDDAGTLVGSHQIPFAVASSLSPDVSVMSNSVVMGGLGALRFLVVAGVGATISRAHPWYSGAALVPATPGPSFGENPNYTRLDVFSLDGNSYAQLRSCPESDHGACTIGALIDGGPGDFSNVTIPGCNDDVVLFGGEPDAGLPDASGDPPLSAICQLDVKTLGNGVVTWHRVAGPMAAAIEKGGTRVFLVRPGYARMVGAEMHISLATEIDLANQTLADQGPIDVAYVDGVGWITVAVDAANGHAWLRRFSCPS